MNPQKGESVLNNDNKPTAETQESFDIKEAAKFLGVSVRTLKYWRKSGKLVPDIIETKKSNFGPRLVQNYSLAQLRLVQNSRYEHSESNFGPRLVQNYSLAQLRLVQNSRYEHSEKGAKFEETGDKFTSDTSEKVTNLPQVVIGSKLKYVVEDAETLIKNSPFIAPSTYYSPKDKVSNLLWANEIPHDVYWGVITVFKNEDYGCIVRLNYDKIFEEENIITGADFSAFDRIVYDAVVTLYVTKNNIFSTTALWRIITQNPHAKITDEIRIKIAKSMFHISNFLMSIITDHNEKPSAWHELNSNPNDPPFKAENKFYRKVQSLYGGRLLEFRWLAERFVTITRTVDGKEIKEMKGIPEVWNILATPLLYQYAASKSQVVSVPLPSLNLSDKADKKTALKRSNHTNELTNFLTREIDTMKKRSSYSHIILLERIYSIDGIDEVQQSENSLKKKRYLTRNKLEKILRRFKENGLIQGYTFHKKIIGRTSSFFSVELWMTSG